MFFLVETIHGSYIADDTKVIGNAIVQLTNPRTIKRRWIRGEEKVLIEPSDTVAVNIGLVNEIKKFEKELKDYYKGVEAK